MAGFFRALIWAFFCIIQLLAYDGAFPSRRPLPLVSHPSRAAQLPPKFPRGHTRPSGLQRRSSAPAELPKQAASFDLPITLGMLAASGQIDSELFQQFAVVGELALEGITRPVKGALSMAMAAARQPGLRGLVVPAESAAEAAVVQEIEVIPVASLAQAVGFFTGTLNIEPTPSQIEQLFEQLSRYDDDFSDVRGQEMAKRAIVVAAAGSHNILSLFPI